MTDPDLATADQLASTATGRKAVLYRMVMDKHTCPFGLKAWDLLRRRGYEIEDRHLTTRPETDAFKAQHDVKSTPQIWLDGKRIGGYDALTEHFGIAKDKNATTYAPVIAIFATTALMALALCWNLYDTFAPMRWAEWFVAFSMVVLAVQKLRDLDGFTNGFLGYDLLAQRYVPYAWVYPFAEAFAGIGMMALIGSMSPLIWLVAPVGLFIGTIGAISVIYAVYIQKRELKCACVGGDSNVPLGAISLTENLMMIAMPLWMMGRAVWG